MKSNAKAPLAINAGVFRQAGSGRKKSRREGRENQGEKLRQKRAFGLLMQSRPAHQLYCADLKVEIPGQYGLYV